MGFFSAIARLFGFGKQEKVAQATPAPVYLPEEGKESKSENGRRAGKRQDTAFRQEKTPVQTPKAKKPQPEKKPQVPREKKPQVPVRQPEASSREEKRPSVDIASWEIPVPERKEGEVYFQDMKLDKRILCALLSDMGFRHCSPIQAQALPRSLAGEDLAGRAQTGTGKTAAFLITVLQKFLAECGRDDRDPWQPMAIILAPTRELAIQIASDAENISAYCGDFRTVAVYGGMDYDRQMQLLAKGVDLVVATPGRLIDFLRKHAVDLKKVQIAVIDEADRMLDMGFIPDVRRIMGYLPDNSKRQTMLFSATLTHEIMDLASRWMRPNPAVIEIEPEHVVAEGVDETVYAVTTAEKMPVLLWLFAHEDCHRVLIFRNRKRDVEVLAGVLQRCGVSCEMLTGDVDQKKRLRILDDFRDGRVRIIVATDVAGRGIHVDDVTHVINYDLPYEAEDYVHRVGRTARAGHKGRAISFADEDCAFVIPEIEKFIERPLPITQPEEDMLKMPDKYRNVSAPRASGSHHFEGHGGSSGSYHHGGQSGRPYGPRVRRGGPRN